jgi:hypothetical protein
MKELEEKYEDRQLKRKEPELPKGGKSRGANESQLKDLRETVKRLERETKLEVGNKDIKIRELEQKLRHVSGSAGRA